MSNKQNKQIICIALLFLFLTANELYAHGEGDIAIFFLKNFIVQIIISVLISFLIIKFYFKSKILDSWQIIIGSVFGTLVSIVLFILTIRYLEDIIFGFNKYLSFFIPLFYLWVLNFSFIILGIFIANRTFRRH